MSRRDRAFPSSTGLHDLPHTLHKELVLQGLVYI
jgi:hypothetical protein